MGKGKGGKPPRPGGKGGKPPRPGGSGKGKGKGKGKPPQVRSPLPRLPVTTHGGQPGGISGASPVFAGSVKGSLKGASPGSFGGASPGSVFNYSPASSAGGDFDFSMGAPSPGGALLAAPSPRAPSPGGKGGYDSGYEAGQLTQCTIYNRAALKAPAGTVIQASQAPEECMIRTRAQFQTLLGNPNDNTFKLHIGTLRPEVSSEVLGSTLMPFGTLVYTCIMMQSEDKSRGFGFAKFQDQASIDRLMAADAAGGVLVLGKKIRVATAKGKDQIPKKQQSQQQGHQKSQASPASASPSGEQSAHSASAASSASGPRFSPVAAVGDASSQGSPMKDSSTSSAAAVTPIVGDDGKPVAGSVPGKLKPQALNPDGTPKPRRRGRRGGRFRTTPKLASSEVLRNKEHCYYNYFQNNLSLWAECQVTSIPFWEGKTGLAFVHLKIAQDGVQEDGREMKRGEIIKANLTRVSKQPQSTTVQVIKETNISFSSESPSMGSWQGSTPSGSTPSTSLAGASPGMPAGFSVVTDFPAGGAPSADTPGQNPVPKDAPMKPPTPAAASPWHQDRQLLVSSNPERNQKPRLAQNAAAKEEELKKELSGIVKDAADKPTSDTAPTVFSTEVKRASFGMKAGQAAAGIIPGYGAGTPAGASFASSSPAGPVGGSFGMSPAGGAAPWGSPPAAAAPWESKPAAAPARNDSPWNAAPTAAAAGALPDINPAVAPSPAVAASPWNAGAPPATTSVPLLTGGPPPIDPHGGSPPHAGAPPMVGGFPAPLGPPGSVPPQIPIPGTPGAAAAPFHGGPGTPGAGGVPPMFQGSPMHNMMMRTAGFAPAPPPGFPKPGPGGHPATPKKKFHARRGKSRSPKPPRHGGSPERGGAPITIESSGSPSQSPPTSGTKRPAAPQGSPKAKAKPW